jgi:hypothetical protein
MSYKNGTLKTNAETALKGFSKKDRRKEGKSNDKHSSQTFPNKQQFQH